MLASSSKCQLDLNFKPTISSTANDFCQIKNTFLHSSKLTYQLNSSLFPDFKTIIWLLYVF